MRNNTRVLSARSYLPFVIRQNKLLLETPTLGTENTAHMYLLRVMADSLITVDYPKPLYLREISPELPVQRTSYKDSREGATLSLKYKKDLLMEI